MMVVRREDHRVVPWKNGRGFTREIALSPPGASVADFDWRISVARIDEDGPFSSFPGVDRTLVLLDGAGVDLDLPEGSIPLPGRHTVANFPGEVAVFARLRAGPVTDLNVMARRAAFVAEVGRIEAPVTLSADGALLVVVALDDGVRVAGHALSATEAVIADHPVAVDGSGALLVIRLTQRRG